MKTHTVSTSSTEEKSQLLAYSLWGLGIVGFSGMHRLYLGQTTHGLALLFTFGGCGLFQFLDVFMIKDLVATYNNGGVKPEPRLNQIESQALTRGNDSVLDDSRTSDDLSDLMSEQEELESKLKDFKN